MPNEGNTLLFKDFWVFGAGHPGDFFKGHVLVENGTVQQVFGEHALPAVIPPHWQVEEGNGKILMPGLCIGHTHIYSTFARGWLASPFSPGSFRELLEQLWWRLDRSLTLEGISASGLVSAVEWIRNGVTSVVDHHASPNAIRGSLDALAQSVCGQAGLRGVFCYEVSDRDGHLKALEGIAENVQFGKQPARFPGRSAGMMGLHASFTLEDSTLAEVAGQQMPIHVHVAEGREDRELHVQRFGISAVQRLHGAGVLVPGSLLAHCLRLEPGDQETLHQQAASVVVNPQSNMNNGAGFFPYADFRGSSLPVLLGNDGYGFDITRDMRTLLLGENLRYSDPTAFSLHDLFQVAFRSTPEFIGEKLGVRLGRISPGYAADFVTYAYLPPTPMRPENFLGHFFFGIMESEKPVDTIVAGRFLMRNKQLELDRRAIFAHARTVCQKTWERA